MTVVPVLRATAVLGVVVAIAYALRAPAPGAACSTGLGACRQPGLPPCGMRLGDWQVARARGSGLSLDHSHSACVPAAVDGELSSAGPVVAVVPQPADVSGDTLVSRIPAARRAAQRAALRLDVLASVPDHWAFAVAGAFLDVDTPHGCAALAVRPPVNAGYALIGGNWQRRPHGFYFERLADACVYDGTNPACPDAPAFVAHEFVPGESFALDLSLRLSDDAWWLDAEIASVLPARDPGGAEARRVLGRMRQRVAEPCWLAPGATGNALVIVIPDPDPATHTPGTRIDVSRFTWLAPETAS